MANASFDQNKEKKEESIKSKQRAAPLSNEIVSALDRSDWLQENDPKALGVAKRAVN